MEELQRSFNPDSEEALAKTAPRALSLGAKAAPTMAVSGKPLPGI